MSEPKNAAEKLGLEPMRPFDPKDVQHTSDLLSRMAGTAFTGRALGEAVDVMEAMVRDERCKVVLTISGAMTMAGLSGLIIDMLERGWVHCIVATGALLGHGLVEDLGMLHYKARRDVADVEYYANRLNRVYDTIEPEENLDAMEQVVRKVFNDLADGELTVLGTGELLSALGEQLPGGGVLQTCSRLGVPVFVPAFTDSELGLDFAVHRRLRERQAKPTLRYDGFRDLRQFCRLCEQHVAKEGKLGIFTIGGGVPRNWAQQVGPYVDIRNKRLGNEGKQVRYSYGVRVCPDPVHYGHLSGCTYAEGISWGKFLPASEGGRYAEVLLDATVGWPLLHQALIDRKV